MKRTFDAAFLNEVANHPEVRPWVGGPDGPIDLAPLLADTRHVALEAEGGGFVYYWHEPGLYEVHSLFLPEARGAPATEAARQSLRFMFTQTDCTEVQTKVPTENLAALGLTRAVGFSKIFERPGNSYWTLTFDRWRARDPEIVAHGQRFHQMLEDAKRAAGSELATHEDDEAHDRAVGASVLMFEAGLIWKAVRTYNRWAQFAGYLPIRATPDLLIDVHDALVGVTDGAMEVVQCR